MIFLRAGNDDGCLFGENQATWYMFTANAGIAPNSILEFTIVSSADYDFAIWGPNPPDCSNLGPPILCNYTATTGSPTGLMLGDGDTSTDSDFNGFVEALIVNPGEVYYILIDNFSNNNAPFTLSWAGDAANILNCGPPCVVTAEAGLPQTQCAGSTFSLSGSATGVSGAETYSWSAVPGGALAYLDNPNAATPSGYHPCHGGSR